MGGQHTRQCPFKGVNLIIFELIRCRTEQKVSQLDNKIYYSCLELHIKTIHQNHLLLLATAQYWRKRSIFDVLNRGQVIEKFASTCSVKLIKLKTHRRRIEIIVKQFSWQCQSEYAIIIVCLATVEDFILKCVVFSWQNDTWTLYSLLYEEMIFSVKNAFITIPNDDRDVLQ